MLHDSMWQGKNLWILKPNNFNRGRGVHVINSIEQVKKLILEFAVNDHPIKLEQFVLQKYIEKPLLVNKRKFDIRLWVLVTHEHSCYLFEEGYLRMSSYEYTVEED